MLTPSVHPRPPLALRRTLALLRTSAHLGAPAHFGAPAPTFGAPAHLGAPAHFGAPAHNFGAPALLSAHTHFGASAHTSAAAPTSAAPAYSHAMHIAYSHARLHIHTLNLSCLIRCMRPMFLRCNPRIQDLMTLIIGQVYLTHTPRWQRLTTAHLVPKCKAPLYLMHHIMIHI